MTDTALRTYTTVVLDIDEHVEVKVQVDSIFAAPQAAIDSLVAADEEEGLTATILKNARHGEFSIVGDRRRWFLHQVRYQRCDREVFCYETEERFVIVTAD